MERTPAMQGYVLLRNMKITKGDEKKAWTDCGRAGNQSERGTHRTYDMRELREEIGEYKEYVKILTRDKEKIKGLRRKIERLENVHEHLKEVDRGETTIGKLL